MKAIGLTDNEKDYILLVHQSFNVPIVITLSIDTNNGHIVATGHIRVLSYSVSCIRGYCLTRAKTIIIGGYCLIRGEDANFTPGCSSVRIEMGLILGLVSTLDAFWSNNLAQMSTNITIFGH